MAQAEPLLPRRRSLAGDESTETMIDRHLEGKSANAVAIYEQYVDLVKSLGSCDLRISPSTIIMFTGARRTFAGVHVSQDEVVAFLDLREELDHPRVRDIVAHEGPLYSHEFVLGSVDELDEEFTDWVQCAHEVGANGIES